MGLRVLISESVFAVVHKPWGPARGAPDSQRDSRRHRLFRVTILLHLLYMKSEPRYGDRRWMKGVLKAPDRKRPHPPRMGETEGISLEGRGCEILLRHEGLAPVRFPRLDAGSGSFQAGVFLPDIGSIGLSFFAGPGAFALWTPGSLSRSSGSAAGRSDGNGHASAIINGASPSLA